MNSELSTEVTFLISRPGALVETYNSRVIADYQVIPEDARALVAAAEDRMNAFGSMDLEISHLRTLSGHTETIDLHDFAEAEKGSE